MTVVCYLSSSHSPSRPTRATARPPNTIRYLNYNKFDTTTRATYPSDIGTYLIPATALFRSFLPSTQDPAMYNREYCFFIIIVTYTYLNLYYCIMSSPGGGVSQSFVRTVETIYQDHLGVTIL